MRQVSDEGEEQVNGTPALHYRGTVDHATAMLRMTDETKQGRAVQVRLSCFGGVKAMTTMTLPGFGTEVKAEAPSDGKVVPVTAGADVLPA
ncbi:hypothetical protein [Streptomyces sp. NPDC059786]|uniref:hypothetical protein n=1 Tax=Streptomyces sp. NPDC059786 TaxID=3346946 RepID=UPI0036631F0C